MYEPLIGKETFQARLAKQTQERVAEKEARVAGEQAAKELRYRQLRQRIVSWYLAKVSETRIIDCLADERAEGTGSGVLAIEPVEPGAEDRWFDRDWLLRQPLREILDNESRSDSVVSLVERLLPVENTYRVSVHTTHHHDGDYHTLRIHTNRYPIASWLFDACFYVCDCECCSPQIR